MPRHMPIIPLHLKISSSFPARSCRSRSARSHTQSRFALLSVEVSATGTPCAIARAVVACTMSLTIWPPIKVAQAFLLAERHQR